MLSTLPSLRSANRNLRTFCEHLNLDPVQGVTDDMLFPLLFCQTDALPNACMNL